MKIYNLFPLLAGKFDAWTPHLERAFRMGFDWVFVNPIQKLGRSGSLYSIADYFDINETFVQPDSPLSPEEQVKSIVGVAEGLGLSMMVDLVINHCAIDSKLVKQHPEWFVRDANGRALNPSCDQDGETVVWHDLARLDHRSSPDTEGLLRYCGDIVEYLIGLGFKGFRCDAAYQIPAVFWRRLIERIKSAHPEIVFVAESLGCTPEQTKETAQAGFDYLFNSAKWWDFSEPWLLKQYELTRETAPSISFPESHDTERLFAESGHNPDAMKQRYLFSALFSSAVMMPIGYEYGFRKRLHVVHSRPEEWEGPGVDLTDFISQVHRIKDNRPVFHEDSPTQVLDHPNPAILLMRKGATKTRDESLIILNKDPWNRQYFYAENLYSYLQDPSPLKDVSTDWPLDYLSTPFEYELTPGMARVLVTETA
jgi:starch synthase (maltosyl-transferring)